MKLLAQLLLIALLAVAGEAKESTESPPRLVVSLADGSRVIGSTGLAALPVHSTALGATIQIPLEKIRAVKFGSPPLSVTVSLANGDRVQGSLENTTLKLATVFGVVTIPWDKTLEIQVQSGAADSTVNDGLVAYYPFDGTAEDQSGHENHARVVGATFADVGGGHQALRFAGNTQSYAIVRRSELLEPVDGITISLWLKGVPGQAGGHGWGTVLRKADNCQPGYFIRGGGISSFIFTGENPCSGGPVVSLEFRPFDESRWQHIVATYSREDGVAKAYQDGKLLAESRATGRLEHSGDLYIGGANVGSDDGGFRGLIGDLRIYNRSLSAAEIALLDSQKPFGQ